MLNVPAALAEEFDIKNVAIGWFTPGERRMLLRTLREDVSLFPRPLDIATIAVVYGSIVPGASICVSREKPHIICYNPLRLRIGFFRRHRRRTSTSHAKNMRDYLQLLLLHEIGHIRHDQLLENVGEDEILRMLGKLPRVSAYARDGWKDVFAETYAIYRWQPSLLGDAAGDSFAELLARIS
jgi:hypothetical protein